MIKNIFGLSSLLSILFCFNVSASTIDLTVEDVTNKLLNDLHEQGAFSNLDDNQINNVREDLMNQVEQKLDLVKSGELSLDPNAPNYFLDFIKDIASGLANLVKGAVKGVINVGKKVFNTISGLLGPVISAGRAIFDTILGNDFIQTVISGIAKVYSTFGPLVGDVIGFIPFIGDAADIIIDLTAPVVGNLVTKDNIALIAGAGTAAFNALNFTVDAAKAAAGSIAPNPSLIAPFTSMSKKASDSDQKKALANVGTLCKNVANQVTKMGEDINKDPKTLKSVQGFLAQCGQFAEFVNATVPAK